MTDATITDAPAAEKPPEVALPVGSLKEALPQLRRPFEPAAVRWKVQSAGERYGIVIAYIDARLVIERLNMVAGEEWEDEYRAHSQGVEECALTVFGRTRRDVGTGQGVQAAKSTRSDSLKRAAVKFGIGVSIYALKSVMLDATSERKVQADGPMLTHNKKTTKGNKDVWSARMSPEAEAWLAQRYEMWLDVRGAELFGDPLGHGDEAGAAGMEGDEGAQAPSAPSEGEEPAGGPELSDERAEAARASAKAVYAEIRGMNGAQIPPAKFRAELKAAGVSHEALDAYVVELERVRDEMKAARS